MAANRPDTTVASCPVKSSPDKFYNFFKFSMNELLKIVPVVFTSVTLLEGEEGKVGCVKLWKYNLGPVPLTAKVKLVSLDDAARSITFAVLEGDLLLVYRSFSATLEFSEGLAKCTFEYTKATLLSPPPDAYVNLVSAIMFPLVDTYLGLSLALK